MISRIKDRISKNGDNQDKAFIRSILRICREFSCLPKEVLKIPIPMYIAMLENINEADKLRKNGNKWRENISDNCE